MPSGRKVFTVPVPIDRAWTFLSSMEDVGTCVPGCEEVRLVNDKLSIWQVRAELGPFSRMLKMEAQTVDFEPPTHGSFLARGRDLETRGDIQLRALSESETEVTYSLTAQAQGFGKSLMNNAIAMVIQEQAEQFARNVVTALSGSKES